MDAEDRKLLYKTLKLAEENNEILHKLHRSMRWRRFFSIFYWILVIGISVGAYYYIQPFLGKFTEAANGFAESVRKIVEFGR